jgi:hypothetical protein
MTGVGKKIEEQKVSNYYDLALTQETSPYVFRIFIFKRNYEKSGQIWV